MKKLLRSLLPIMLSLCIVLSAFPAVSFAAAAPAREETEIDPSVAASAFDDGNELPVVPADNEEPAEADAVAYTVEYYQQDLEGEGYTLAETRNLSGKAGDEANAEQKEYTGFTFNAVKSEPNGTIAADGTTVLKLYYDRNLYTVTWKLTSNETKETYRYGATPSFKGNAEKAADEHGSYSVGWDQALVPVTGDVTYTLKYVVDCEASIVKGETWATLQLALDHAKKGDTIRIDKDITISKDITVPAGVTLLLPCMDNDKGYQERNQFGKIILMNPNGTDTSGNGLGKNAKLYRTVTVKKGVTITVKGSLMVNAVTGRKATANSDQDITGGYAVLDLQGNITVEDGGHLDAFGYVRGSGVVSAKKGGTVGDLYVVRHWRGGTQAQKAYNAGIYPMNEYDCHNIETTLRIEYGAVLEGIVKMYAQGGYYYTRFLQVDNSNGLIRLTDQNSSILLRTYADGKERYEIVGGADFSLSALTVIGVTLSTGDFIYPIDGDIDLVLNAGEYHFRNDYKFLPGATLKLNHGASLTVDEGKTLIFYQEFNNGDFPKATRYPSRAPAQLQIAEGASFTNAGTFAGDIYTESAEILIGAAPVWETSTKETKCMATGKQPVEEYTLTMNHKLTITRPHHTWKFGDDKSIVWLGGLADYSAVEAAKAKIPADLSIYTAESVKALNDALAAVVEGLPEEKQPQVDAWAKAINDALAALVPKEGTPADYSAVKAALAKVPADLSIYIDSSREALENAVNAVEYGLLTEDQEKVDAFAKAINDAIDALIVKPADYSRIETAKMLLPEDLSVYTAESVKRVKDALNAVEDGVLITQQDKIEAWANDIIEAIAALVLRPADYSKLEAAKATIPADLSQYSLESVHALEQVLAQIEEGLNITDQSKVDAWTKAVEAAIKKLVKKCAGGADCPGKKFTDMPPVDNWAHEGIDFALSRGLFNGMSETTFAPNGKMTRAMLVTVLWRLAGQPIEGKLTFGDVKTGMWYTDAIKWATKKGIVNGIEYGVFAPDMLVTREQLAAILYRYAGEPEGEANLSGFADQSKVGDWAIKAVCWANNAGIVQGALDSEGKLWLNPKNSATRAEVAAMLMRFIVNCT